MRRYRAQVLSVTQGLKVADLACGTYKTSALYLRRFGPVCSNRLVFNILNGLNVLVVYIL